MRNTTLTLLTGLALAATAQAGEDYSAKAPAPAPAPCLWEWFAGASVGYAFDAEAVITNGQVGAEYSCPGSDSSHALFLEVGYGSWDKDHTIRNARDSVKVKMDNDFVPITINYKYETSLTQSLNWFIGGGLGVAVSQVEIKIKNFDKTSDDSTEFYCQLFAGLTYEVNEQWDITTSARYLWQNLSDHKILEQKVDHNGLDDFYLDLGFRYNF